MKKIDFAECIDSFFGCYLVEQRNVSPDTIAAYSDALSLLMRFVENKTGKTFEKQCLEDFSHDTILDFLDYLEKDRANSVRTRNTRLMFIRTFFRHIACRYPSALATYSRIATIPCKITRTRLVSYLEPEVISEIIKSIDRKSPYGSQEYLLITFLVQTGIRVSELCNIRFSDILGKDNPCLRILGKGRKERFVRLNSEICEMLREIQRASPEQEFIFINRYGKQISRHGIAYILDRVMSRAKVLRPALADKKMSPHILRHTNAMFLLYGGCDLASISKWLGHSSVATTNIYVQADIRMLDKALSKCRFFEIPYSQYKATDKVLAKLDEIRKKYRR